MKEVKVIKNNSVGLISEVVILFLLLYFLMMSFIIKELYIVVQFLISFLLINLSYNNYKINKKSKNGIIYLICGFLLLVITIINYVR